MSREQPTVTVSLYGSLQDYADCVVGAEFVAASPHQAARRAAYAVLGLATPSDAPPGRWAVALCRGVDGGWEKVLVGAEG